MSESVVYAGSAVAAGGPSVSFNSSMTLEGINYVVVDVLSTKTVAVNLGVTAAELRLLVIKPSVAKDTLTFKVNAVATVYKLDQPVILAGSTASVFLGADPAANSLTFTNQIVPATDVKIEIFVGRKLI
jgi:hypothetical protein